jgi:hypothetical protein
MLERHPPHGRQARGKSAKGDDLLGLVEDVVGSTIIQALASRGWHWSCSVNAPVDAPAGQAGRQV